MTLTVADNPARAETTFVSSPYASSFASVGYGPIGVAFDTLGNLYVADQPDGHVYKFPPGGGVASSATQLTGVLNSPTGVAFGKDGDLYVAASGSGEIEKIDPSSGSILGNVASGLPDAHGIVFDPLTSDLFVSEPNAGTGIFKASADGTVTPYSSFNADGIAVAPDGTLFASGWGANAGQIAEITGTGSTSPGTAMIVANVPNADGIAVGVQSGSSMASVLWVNRNDGTITEIDLTSSPAATTDIITGGSRGDFDTLGTDGCLYATQRDSVIKVTAADGSCPFGAPPTPTLTITTTSLPSATWGQSYSASLAATGGTPPYAWSVTAGLLPTMTPVCLGTAPGSFCYPLFDPSSGSITGVPQYAGTYSFTVTVSDSSNPVMTASKTFSLTVEPLSPLQTWSLTNTQNGSVVTNPHVGVVLVGNWWCTLFGANLPPQCPSSFAMHYPYTCPNFANNSCLVEASALLGALRGLVVNDYNDSASGGYDYGLSQIVGAGLQTRLYNGSFYAGPVIGGVTGSTLNGFAGSFGITSQSDVNDTVFVILYAPNLLTCPNPSTNTMTGGGRPGVYGSFVTAYVYLEDYKNNCAGDLNQQSPIQITPQQFATYAASHEIDEALTSPGAGGSNIVGWLVPPNMQIADPCQARNAAGQTHYGTSAAYPFDNFARDSRGTVVSAYVNPSTDLCYPGVDTSVPPG